METFQDRDVSHPTCRPYHRDSFSFLLTVTSPGATVIDLTAFTTIFVFVVLTGFSQLLQYHSSYFSFSVISTCDNLLVSKTFFKGKLFTLTAVFHLLFHEREGSVTERPGEGKWRLEVFLGEI